MIGKRALGDPRNSLVRHFVRLMVEFQASYFVFENVRGLTIGAHRKFLDEIIAEFRKSGAGTGASQSNWAAEGGK
jgi:DNA (cytosine-5)-methyltransferase 1